MTTQVCKLYAKLDIRIETEQVPTISANQVRVAIGAGGICGSDLHYFLDGGFGPVRVKQPIVLGHEIAGRVVEICGDSHGL